MDAPATARAYYAALDDERLDDLRDLLAPGFTQHRPDRTFTDRDDFLTFIDTDRPHTDTTHHLHGIYVPHTPTTRTHERHTENGVAVHRISTTPEPTDTTTDERQTVLVHGTVERQNGDTIVDFIDVFEILADRITTLHTYTQ